MKIKDKRYLKYVLSWFILSAITLAAGITYAAQLRGYPAIGSEWLSPLMIATALYIIWNRKRWAAEIKDAINSDWLDD